MLNKLVTLSLLLFFACSSSKNIEAEEAITEVPEKLGYRILPELTTTHCTFAVDEVEPTKQPLIKNHTDLIVGSKIGKQIAILSSYAEEDSLIEMRGNAFLKTVHEAFDRHHPLTLSPDDIWLLIIQGTGLHIHENFESLRNVLFSPKSSRKLSSRDDSLAQFQPEHWAAAIDQLAQDAEKESKLPVDSLFTSVFSTSTPTNKTVTQITMLQAFEKQFIEYTTESGCGIPYITLTGTVEDWQKLKQKANALRPITPKGWVDELNPVFDEFIRARQGKPNQAFWQRFYKSASTYGKFSMTGWVIKFFPYTKSLKSTSYDSLLGMTKAEIVYPPNPYLYDEDYLISDLTFSDFPKSLTKIDLKWTDYFEGKAYPMQLIGGFMGATQNDTSLALSPHIAWVAVHADSAYVRTRNWNRKSPKRNDFSHDSSGF
ncbi:MAG: DUF4419 domain-containing protein, partial [Bacteroidota bacterium]